MHLARGPTPTAESIAWALCCSPGSVYLPGALPEVTSPGAPPQHRSAHKRNGERPARAASSIQGPADKAGDRCSRNIPARVRPVSRRTMNGRRGGPDASLLFGNRRALLLEQFTKSSVPTKQTKLSRHAGVTDKWATDSEAPRWYTRSQSVAAARAVT